MKNLLFKLFSGNVVVSGSSFVASIILLRSLGIDGYGQYVTLLAALTTVNSFTRLPFWQGLLKHPNADGLENVFGIALIIEGLLGILGVVVLIILTKVLTIDLPLYFCCIPLIYFRNTTQFPLRYREKYGLYAIITSSGAIFRLFSFYILSCNSDQVGQYILFYTLSVCLEESLFLYFSIRHLKPAFNRCGSNFIKENSRLFYALYLNASLKSLYRGADILLVNYLFGNTVTGAFKLIKNSGILFQIIIDPFYQYYYRKDIVNFTIGQNWKPPINTGMILLGYLGVNLLGLIILKFVYEQPSEQKVYFLVFNIGFLIQFFTIRLQGILIAKGEDYYLSKAILFAAVGYLLVILIAPYTSLIILYLSWPIFYALWTIIILKRYENYLS